MFFIFESIQQDNPASHVSIKITSMAENLFPQNFRGPHLTALAPNIIDLKTLLAWQLK